LKSYRHAVPPAPGILQTINPDPFRGPFKRSDPEAGKKYAADVQNLIETATSGKIAGFIAETIQGVGGAIEFADGYLAEAVKHVKAAGGLYIADEVQAGLGRTGTKFWGYENYGVKPDIVTMAKGIGNGAPLAAVVTTPEIAAAFATKSHFNTYGGNPVVSAIGGAVLDVLKEDNIQAKALKLGNRLLDGLRQLQKKYPLLGDVRGRGLLIGVEFVKDLKSLEPATAECAAVHERARELGALIGKGGLYGNVLRIKPPMCITEEDVDYTLQVLDIALKEVTTGARK